MKAIDERPLQDLQEGNGAAMPEDAPLMGLVWLKWGQQEVSCLGLYKAPGVAARLHKGAESPAGEPPSAVICYPSGEEGLAAEVESARALAPNAVVLVLVPSPNLHLARRARGEG